MSRGVVEFGQGGDNDAGFLPAAPSIAEKGARHEGVLTWVQGFDSRPGSNPWKGSN